jgi:mannose-6-phosphate isomerase-like protein (cupin superfamily)
MGLTRRDCCLLLLPVVAASASSSDTKLASKAYRFEDLPARKREVTVSRPVLDGQTHEGTSLELHETELAPGSAPHPPHHHVHEEIFMIREGTVEVTISGHSTTLGPGAVAFVASNEEHGIRNRGTTPAQYFVVEIGTRKPA